MNSWLLLEADPAVRVFCERAAYLEGRAGRVIDFWVSPWMFVVRIIAALSHQYGIEWQTGSTVRHVVELIEAVFAVHSFRSEVAHPRAATKGIDPAAA